MAELIIDDGISVAPEHLRVHLHSLRRAAEHLRAADRQLRSAAAVDIAFDLHRAWLARIETETTALAAALAQSIDRYTEAERLTETLMRWGLGWLGSGGFEQASGRLSQLIDLGLLLSGTSPSVDAAGLRLHPTARGSAVAPRSLVDVISRIPRDGSQVRIERYASPSGVRWMVYVAGTAAGSLGTSTEPFDMKSNVEAVADRPSASEAAVREAMRRAGIAATDEVMLVGHSQGGLLAARIAEDRRYRVVQCITVGAPLGTTAATVPTLAIAHRDDAVPGLAGVARPSALRLTVSTDSPGRGSLPAAHQLDGYLATARRIDLSTEPSIHTVQTRIDRFASGLGSASDWKASRVS